MSGRTGVNFRWMTGIKIGDMDDADIIKDLSPWHNVAIPVSVMDTQHRLAGIML